MCNVYMSKQSKVVFLFPLETWCVYTGKYKTDIGLRKGEKRRKKKKKRVRRAKQYGSAFQTDMHQDQHTVEFL